MTLAESASRDGAGSSNTTLLTALGLTGLCFFNGLLQEGLDALVGILSIYTVLALSQLVSKDLGWVFDDLLEILDTLLGVLDIETLLTPAELGRRAVSHRNHVVRCDGDDLTEIVDELLEVVSSASPLHIRRSHSLTGAVLKKLVIDIDCAMFLVSEERSVMASMFCTICSALTCP